MPSGATNAGKSLGSVSGSGMRIGSAAGAATTGVGAGDIAAAAGAAADPTGFSSKNFGFSAATAITGSRATGAEIGAETGAEIGVETGAVTVETLVVSKSSGSKNALLMRTSIEVVLVDVLNNTVWH